MNNIERDLRRRLKKSIKKRKELNDRLIKYEEVIDKAINHLDLFISDENLSKYDLLKILMATKKY